MLFVLCAKFGVAFAYNVMYLGNSSLFPVLFASSALGYCSFLNRIFSAVSPFLVNLPEPWPLVIFCVMALISGIASFWLKDIDKVGLEKKLNSVLVSRTASARNSVRIGSRISSKRQSGVYDTPLKQD